LKESSSPRTVDGTSCMSVLAQDFRYATLRMDTQVFLVL